MKKRNNTLVILIFTVFVLMTLFTNHSGAANNEATISTILTGMQNQNISVDEWSLYTKKTVDLNSIQEVKQLTEQYRQYKWRYEETDDVYKAIGIFKNEEKNVTEKLQLLSTLTNHHSQSYILYELKATGSRGNEKELHDYFKSQSFDIFHENTTIFTCVKGHLDDMMKDVLHGKSEDLLKEFNAVPIEQMKEQYFVSVSAKTSVWDESIPTVKGNMNIQIALRSAGLGDKTTVVVGTPIITSEY
ncbi:YwmB family TATA-box binding protein [Metabacillus herbersteinensis]|uniref:YwmB family TATA-box binding protein n=1 Tax=Metabacillus herbersteinensis TaxID=283816 RepID=A0ABV6GFN4_9BACI